MSWISNLMAAALVGVVLFGSDTTLFAGMGDPPSNPRCFGDQRSGTARMGLTPGQYFEAFGFDNAGEYNQTAMFVVCEGELSSDN